MIYMYKNELSIVIPAYEEAENLPQLIEEITESVPTSICYEIIVVDDASQDDTWQVLEDIKRHCECLKIIRHNVNRGQSAALMTAINNAQYNWVVSLDGDGQIDPKDISKLIECLKKQKNYEKGILIVGHRENRQDTLGKRWGSKMANAVRRLVLKDCCLDTGCSLKLFPRQAILALPLFNHFHRFIPAMLATIDIRTINVPVNHRARKYGYSKYGINNRLWVSLADLFGVFWLRKRIIIMGNLPKKND